MTNVLETTLSNAKPMTTFEGDEIPGTAIVKKMMNRTQVNALIVIAETSENASYRDTGKHTYRNFTIGDKSYTVRLEISRAARREVQITVNPIETEPPKPENTSTIEDGLLVEVKDTVEYIHLSDKPSPFETYIKIWHGTHIIVEGNITILNLSGFNRAMALAQKKIEAKFTQSVFGN